jgi:inorganic pyrophosphatase
MTASERRSFLDLRVETGFWLALDRLIATGTVKVDRPRGSRHPRFPRLIYPMDYGFVTGTRGGDGREVDVWLGSAPGRLLVGAICTVDLRQRNVELKLLLGCTAQQIQRVLRFHNRGEMRAVLLPRRQRRANRR